MTDKELTEWEHQSHVITVLTSREMGAWLGRRDSRLLQDIRQEIDKWHHLTDKAFNDGIDTALEIIDKHLKRFERDKI